MSISLDSYPIPLRNKKGEINAYTWIDKQYLTECEKYRWYRTGYGYAATGVGPNGKETKLHRFIAQLANIDLSNDIDHEDHNRLNNTIANLRPATRSQNLSNRNFQSNNTSGFKGVYWYKTRDKWLASICIKKKQICLGYFVSKIDAAKAYNDAAIKYFGEFAFLNKIDNE